MHDRFPLTRVELELTESCNLACSFCYNSCEPVVCSDPFRIVTSLADDGLFELVLTGGEPTQHPAFFDIVNHASSIIPRVMIQSNGVFFQDAGHVARLQKLNVFCVNFSLHGSRTIHEGLTRTTGSFDATCSALQHAVSAGIRVVSNLVLTSLNTDLQALRDLMHIHRSLGVQEVTVTRFIPSGVGRESRELVVSQSAFADAIRGLRKLSAEMGISVLLANATPLCRLPEDLGDMCNRCSFGADKFYVDVHGRVLLCGMSRIAVGNLTDGSISEVTQTSEIVQRYRSSTLLPIVCRSCEHLMACGGGCRAAAFAHTKCADGFDPLDFSLPAGGPHNDI